MQVSLLKLPSFRLKLGISVILFCYAMYTLMWFAWRDEMLQEMNDQLWFVGPLWFVGVGSLISSLRRKWRIISSSVVMSWMAMFFIFFSLFFPIVDGQILCDVPTSYGVPDGVIMASKRSACDSEITLSIAKYLMKAYFSIIPVSPVFIVQSLNNGPLDMRYDDALGRRTNPEWKASDTIQMMPVIPITP